MYENNKDYPRDVALLYLNRKITYGELFDWIDQTASAFTAVGVKQHDIVTIAMPSMPEALYCVYALNRLGAVANMIHPLASENEICHYLNEVNSTVFVMFSDTYELVKNDIGKTNVQKAIVVSPVDSLSSPARLLYRLATKETKELAGSVFVSWNDFICSGKNTIVHYQSHDPNEMAIISHTGGTTGEPKGVMCSDNNINALIYQSSANLGLRRQMTGLVVLPPFINYSLLESMLDLLYLGFKVVLVPEYKPDQQDKYIKKYRPNMINSIPAYWEELLRIPNIDKIDMSCLKVCYYGGEAMNPDSEIAVNKLLHSCGCREGLLKGLGSTEMMAAATQTYPNCNKTGSAGIPLFWVNCKIVDPDSMEELPYDRQGEICFSGPTLMMGYYKNEEETNQIIKYHSDGERWIHTGDLGHIDENGFLFVTGRIKRILMTKGKDGNITKIFPDRIEKVLGSHQAVQSCCVIGIPDEHRINYPKAFIVLSNSFTDKQLITEELRKLCSDNLPGYMNPDQYEFISDMPRTSRGKIDYRALEQEPVSES